MLASQMFILYRLFMLTVISGKLRPVKRNSGFSLKLAVMSNVIVDISGLRLGQISIRKM